MTDLLARVEAARALIDKPSKWCKGSYHSGGFHGFDRHCSLGAVAASTPNYDERDQIYRALEAALPPADRRKPHALATYNDNHNHAEVMAWWDRALKSLDQS